MSRWLPSIKTVVSLRDANSDMVAPSAHLLNYLSRGLGRAETAFFCSLPGWQSGSMLTLTARASASLVDCDDPCREREVMHFEAALGW